MSHNFFLQAWIWDKYIEDNWYPIHSVHLPFALYIFHQDKYLKKRLDWIYDWCMNSLSKPQSLNTKI